MSLRSRALHPWAKPGGILRHVAWSSTINSSMRRHLVGDRSRGHRSFLAVHPVATHEVVDRVVSLDGLARVTPEPIQHVVLHEPALDIPVVDVGDLELASTRRLQV